jgi:predicted TIM-barrel fold metal-dependent hydrolase
MGYNGKVVIDADSHIREYVDFDNRYRKYIDPAYREQFDALSAAMQRWQRSPDDIGFPGFLWPRPPAHPLGVYDAYAMPRDSKPENRQAIRPGREILNEANYDPKIRLRDMDIAGVDISVLFASQSDGFCMLDDVGFENALDHAYNRSTSDYCADTAGRVRWIANSSLRDISVAISELRYWAEHDENFVGMFVPRTCPDGTMLDNPRLHPLFAASEELDLPLWVHGGSNRPPLTPWVDSPGGIYHGIGGMYAMHALVGGGVFDLFPKLRAGIFESGIGWTPWFVEKLDDSYGPGSARSPKLKRTPSEIVAEGRFYVSIEAEEALIEHAVDELGDEIFLFATDYPHQGSPWPNGVKFVTEREGLSEASKEKILGGNALRFCPRLAG